MTSRVVFNRIREEYFKHSGSRHDKHHRDVNNNVNLLRKFFFYFSVMYLSVLNSPENLELFLDAATRKIENL